MSTNRQETGNRRQETDLVLEVTPPEVGHLKNGRFGLGVKSGVEHSIVYYS